MRMRMLAVDTTGDGNYDSMVVDISGDGNLDTLVAVGSHKTE